MREKKIKLLGESEEECQACGSKEIILVRTNEHGVSFLNTIKVCTNEKCWRYSDLEKLKLWKRKIY